MSISRGPLIFSFLSLVISPVNCSLLSHLKLPWCWFLLDYTNDASLREFPRTNSATRPDETVDKGIDWLGFIRGKDFIGIKIWGVEGNTAFISAISPPSFFSFISPFRQTLPRSLSLWITLHVGHSGNSRWNKPLSFHWLQHRDRVSMCRITGIKLEVIRWMWPLLWYLYLHISASECWFGSNGLLSMSLVRSLSPDSECKNCKKN